MTEGGLGDLQYEQPQGAQNFPEVKEQPLSLSLSLWLPDTVQRGLTDWLSPTLTPASPQFHLLTGSHFWSLLWL